jgi:hypothetical protein
MTGSPNPSSNPDPSLPGQTMNSIPSSSDATLDDVKRPPSIITQKTAPREAATAPREQQVQPGAGYANQPGEGYANQGPPGYGSPFAPDTGRSRMSSGSLAERSMSILSTVAHFVIDEYPLERLRAQPQEAQLNFDEEQGSPVTHQVREGLERGPPGASPLSHGGGSGRAAGNGLAGSGLESRLPHSRAYYEARERDWGTPYSQDGGRSARVRPQGAVSRCFFYHFIIF